MSEIADSPELHTLGIIAGNRTLPLLLAREARRAGISRLVGVAFEGETDPAFAGLVDDIEWIRVGQLSRMIKAFKSRGVTRCVMVGQIAPKNLFELRPDLRAMGLLLGLKEKNAHSLFGGIAGELARDGITLIEATPWLKPAMPGKGFCLGPPPTAKQRTEIEFAHRIAIEISRLDIGQLAVVKDGAVLAVEGFEGTDRCLARGGELAGKEGGAVAVKVAKPDHDMRFDIPCLGPRTIETCAKSGVAVLAFEAGRALLLEQEACERLAKEHKISITTIG